MNRRGAIIAAISTLFGGFNLLAQPDTKHDTMEGNIFMMPVPERAVLSLSDGTDEGITSITVTYKKLRVVLTAAEIMDALESK